jgi:hypothetical protein
MTLVVLAAVLGPGIKKKVMTAEGSRPMILLPETPPLSEADSLYLANSCAGWYDKFLANSCFNGGVVIAKNGRVIFERYKGEAETGSGIPFESNTSIHIASVSKTFTAMAVLKLMEEGKLNLDDSLGVYFPGFPYPGVTVRTLLNHRSGLPNYLSFMEKLGWDQSAFMHNADILKALMEHKAELENVVPANRHFSYCNTNYALLALIVEKVSGIAYPEFLQSTFFTPLGMKNSFVFNSTDSARAHGSYECSGRRIPDNYQDRVYGDKNIYSTPRDLLLWDRALRSGLLFKEETIKMAYTPYSLEKPGVRNYGLGWRMFLFPDGKKVIYHNGWWHGNNASFIRMIDENATIIVLGSRYSKLVYRSRDLINLFNSSEVPDEEE